MRYVQYDPMDNDLEINAALDIPQNFPHKTTTQQNNCSCSFNEDPK